MSEKDHSLYIYMATAVLIDKKGLMRVNALVLLLSMVMPNSFTESMILNKILSTVQVICAQEHDLELCWVCSHLVYFKAV